MLNRNSRIAAALAASAVASLAATPAAAQGWGWGGGWGGHHHRSHVDAGDIIAGVLIIGGIAAIASAASKGKRDRDRRDDEYRGDYPRERQGNYSGNENDQQWQQNGGVDSAVNRCSNEVSRGSGRGVNVETINRDGDGWRVSGRTGDGADFSCSVDGSGQIRNVQVGGRAY
jgi:hypothetical protein